MARLNVRTVEERLDKLAGRGSYDREFLFELLLAYGKPKGTVTRLRMGDLNVAQDKRDVLLKKVVLFRETDGDVMAELDDLIGTPQVTRFSPRFIIVTDYAELAAIDLKTSERIILPIAKINEQVAFFLPWAGMEKVQYVSEAHADVKAAERMGKLYDELLKANPDIADDDAGRHMFNVFFTRLLFCFFAEDTALFSDGLFTTTVGNQSLPDGSDTADLLADVFLALDTQSKLKKPARLEDFPYVNGRLFTQRENDRVPRFSAKARTALLELGTLDWGEINPDIFGSMFQAVVDPRQRSGLGQHYTSVPNILKTIEPLFLDELRDQFDQYFDRTKKLEELLGRISKIKVFDPACGSGNFLVIAYKELRRLEIAIVERLMELEPKYRGVSFDSVVQIGHFYGIEIDDFATEVAILSLWIAKHQMNMESQERLGAALSFPLIPLKEAGHIVAGNAARVDWNEVCPNDGTEEIYLIGNPPYFGGKKQTREQKLDLAYAFENEKFSKNLDYISIWFIKGARYVTGSNSSLAFVSTNSVTQGEHVGLLFPALFAMGVEIGFAHVSFKWENNAKSNAGVTVVVISLRSERSGPVYLYEGDHRTSVRHLNGYLIPGPNVFISRRNSPIARTFPRMRFGSMPRDGGGLILQAHEARDLMDMQPKARRFVKGYVGADDLINGAERYCLWIRDHEYQAAQEVPQLVARFSRVAAARTSEKASAATAKFAAEPYRFVQRAYKPTDAIIVPRVSSEKRDYVPMGYVGPETVISDAAFAVYDAEPWLFAILTSRMHMAWLRAVGGKMKTDFRYSNTIVYNNFPVPEGALTDAVKEELNEAALRILDVREYHSEATLAELYDREKMPQNLRDAHARVDALVDALYSKRPYETDEDRLADLFALYKKMTTEPATAQVKGE